MVPYRKNFYLVLALLDTFCRHDIKKQKNDENKKAVQAEDLPSLFMGE